MRRLREYTGTNTLRAMVLLVGTFVATVALGTVALTTFITVTQIAAPAAPAAGSAGLYADSTSNTWKASNNGGGWFDLITTATGSTLYCLLTGCVVSGQFQDTQNPASTAFADGAIIANPAACGANEILVGAGVAGAGKATMDCEGDIVGVKMNLTGAFVGTSTMDQQGAINNTSSAVPTGGTAGDVWINDGLTISGSTNFRPTATLGTGATSWMSLQAPSAITQTGALTALDINTSTNLTANGTNLIAEQITTKAVTAAVARSEIGLNISFGNTQANAGLTTASGISMTMGTMTTSDTTASSVKNGVSVTFPSSALVLSGTGSVVSGNGFIFQPITTGPASGTLTAVNIGTITTPGAGTENAITVGTGWDTAIDVASSAFKVTGAGALTITATATKNTCTLTTGTPSTCTATVTSGCLPICSYGALGVGSVAPVDPVYCTVSGTTLTATGGNTSVNVINFICL